MSRLDHFDVFPPSLFPPTSPIRPQSEQARPVSLPPIAYKGQPVVTTEALAEAYGCDPKQIRQNLANNRDRFIEGKHFYLLQGRELEEFRLCLSNCQAQDLCVENFDSQIISPKARNLTLWLEQGAARHAKMLNTDAAWDVFEMLEETFFRVARSGEAPKGKAVKPRQPSAEITARAVATSLRALSRMKVYPDEMRAVFAAKSVVVLTGEPLEPLLPPIKNNRETWMSPTALAEHFQVSSQRIGRLLITLGLHGDLDPEHIHSQPIWSKSPYSDKQVVTYIYDPAVVIPRLSEALGVKSGSQQQNLLNGDAA